MIASYPRFSRANGTVLTKNRLTISLLLGRTIQMFAGRQCGVSFKMLRSQRFGNGVLLAEPFAQINEPTAM